MYASPDQRYFRIEAEAMGLWVYNYEDWPVYTPVHYICKVCSYKNLWGWEALQIDFEVNGT